MEHILYTQCDSGDCGGTCAYCCLSICKVCGQADIELELTRPGPKLLPCPFCNGAADWAEGEQKLLYKNEQVYCTICYASTPPDVDKAAAAQWWNNRGTSSREYIEDIKYGIDRIEKLVGN